MLLSDTPLCLKRTRPLAIIVRIPMRIFENLLICMIGIRANPNRGTPGFVGNINSAILRYNGAPLVNPTTNDTADNLLAETSLAVSRG